MERTEKERNDRKGKRRNGEERFMYRGLRLEKQAHRGGKKGKEYKDEEKRKTRRRRILKGQETEEHEQRWILGRLIRGVDRWKSMNMDERIIACLRGSMRKGWMVEVDERMEN